MPLNLLVVVPERRKQSRSSPQPGLRWSLATIGLVVVTWIAFGSTLRAEETWDDWIWLSIAKAPSLKMLAGIWVDPNLPDYLPLTASGWWLAGRISESPLEIIHAANLILHALSAVLFAALLRKLALPGAWIATVLYAVHPCCVESVAWASEFKNCLSQPLYLAAAVSWAQSGLLASNRIKRHGWYIASFGFFVAALLSKPAGVMLPLVLLLLGWWKTGHLSWHVVLAAVPHLASATIAGTVTLHFQVNHAIDAQGLAAFDVAERLARLGPCIFWYVGQLFWPAHRTPLVSDLIQTPSLAVSVIASLALANCFLVALKGRPRLLRSVAIALIGFSLMLLPVLGLLPMSFHRVGWVADRFMYLPMLCLVAPVGVGLTLLGQRLGVHGQRVVTLVASLVIASLVVMSHDYARAWCTDHTLWTLALQKDPQAWLAHGRLGVIELKAGRSDIAMTHFLAASRLKPELHETHANLGTALRTVGRIEEAIAEYRRALSLAPDNEQNLVNLTNALGLTGRTGESESILRSHLDRRPSSAVAWTMLGLTLEARGRRAEAVWALKKALQVNPSLNEARSALGVLEPNTDVP